MAMPNDRINCGLKAHSFGRRTPPPSPKATSHKVRLWFYLLFGPAWPNLRDASPSCRICLNDFSIFSASLKEYLSRVVRKKEKATSFWYSPTPRCDNPFWHLYTLPLICYDHLKIESIEVKQISSLCKTRMRVPVSVYKKYANQCLLIYM